MKRAEDIAAAANADAALRAWTAPKTRRLATSAAEAGDTISFDGVEIPS